MKINEIANGISESSTMAEAARGDKRALVDTTIQIDRVKMPRRKRQLEESLKNFSWRFGTCTSLLEFKATIIQECITIHNQLRRPGARFTFSRDALLEKAHPQSKLRSHIFNNLIQVFPPRRWSDEQDQRLAEQARLQLENIIPRLYDWFVNKSGVEIVRDRLKCNRAAEPPRKKMAAFEANLPICKRRVNKTCVVEEFIRGRGPVIARSLRPLSGGSEQIERALRVIEEVIVDADSNLSHGDCRRIGDVLTQLPQFVRFSKNFRSIF